jgi:hypothetical protein
MDYEYMNYYINIAEYSMYLYKAKLTIKKINIQLK